jgi:hypothetical protein
LYSRPDPVAARRRPAVAHRRASPSESPRPSSARKAGLASHKPIHQRTATAAGRLAPVDGTGWFAIVAVEVCATVSHSPGLYGRRADAEPPRYRALTRCSVRYRTDGSTARERDARSPAVAMSGLLGCGGGPMAWLAYLLYVLDRPAREKRGSGDAARGPPARSLMAGAGGRRQRGGVLRDLDL